MEKSRKYLARKFVIATIVVVLVASALTTLPIQSEAQAPSSGIDPKLLAKANAGDSASQTSVGFAYAEGDGVPRDYAQAALWFRKAADQGNASAEYDLGLFYSNGQGVPQDYAQAAAWYRKAAEQGNAVAQLNIGVLYDKGQGLTWGGHLG